MQANKQLYDLQELDWKIADVDKRLAEVRARLEDDSELTATRLRLEELAARFEALTSDRRAAERGIAEHQENLQRVEARLYGGAVTNPKALSAAEEEREFIVSRLRVEEDGLLELMVESEDAESSRDAAQSALDRLEAERPAEKEELLNSEKQLMGELDAMGRSRGLITPALPRELLSRYDSLRKTKNGHAVAKVVRGMCQGCRLTVTTMELQRARSSEDITQCSSCQRILYVM